MKEHTLSSFTILNQKLVNMEATRALHMKGGTGEESYAKNSSLQRKAITNAMPIMEEAIKDVYCRLLPKTLCISDMGCSSGPNTFYAVSLLIEAVDGIRKSLGHESPPEFLIHLNDLPSNDFNSVFRSLPKFYQDLKERIGSGFGPCFLTGVPGSFYGRLFPSQSLHFVHSSNSLHWLSQTPEEAKDNNGSIYLSTGNNPSNIANAYMKQFNRNFLIFLKNRAEELVVSGCMVLTLSGRRLEDPGAEKNPSSVGIFYKTLQDMVNEGFIEREKLDSFNMPLYQPSVPELQALVEVEGSFSIVRLQINDLHKHKEEIPSTPDGGLDVVKTFRAVIEPLLASHFGEDIVDEFFSRLGEDFTNNLSKKLTKLINVTLLLKKKSD